MTGVQLEPETQPVTVTANADSGNVTLTTPEKSSVEIIADAQPVCVDPDGQTVVDVSPQTQIVAVTASVEPAQPVEVEVGQATVNVTASTVGIQGPPGPTRTVTYVTPDEFEQNSEFAYFGWVQWPNENDPWRILRVSIGDWQRVKATAENNPSYADFASAWTDRAILSFQVG